MREFRLIKLRQDNGAMQMAIDEAILITRAKGLVQDTLRFYTWKPACITIGYFQSLKKEINLEKVKEYEIDIVRRYTGGGAVLHDKELTYSIVISENEVSENIEKSYSEICDFIIFGLNRLGIKAEFKPINDIIVGGKKISGSAQTRKFGFVLQHGTILFDLNLDKMFSVLKIPDEKIKDKLISNAKERVTSLRNLGIEISPQELEKILRESFEKKFGVKLVESDLSKEEIKLAEKLYREKYSKKEWNFWR
jgi:lipoate-protein ligase A